MQEGRTMPAGQSLQCLAQACGPFWGEIGVRSGCWDLCVGGEALPMVAWRLGHRAGSDCRDHAEKGPGQYRAGPLGECRLILGENQQAWMKTSCGL